MENYKTKLLLITSRTDINLHLIVHELNKRFKSAEDMENYILSYCFEVAQNLKINFWPTDKKLIFSDFMPSHLNSDLFIGD